MRRPQCIGRNAADYAPTFKAQIQRNYFKPKRPETNWSLAQIWAAAHGLNTPAVQYTVQISYLLGHTFLVQVFQYQFGQTT